MDTETGERPVRVLIVDDQALIREGLEMLLGLSPGIQVVGTAIDGEDAIRVAGEQRPDVVLMDLRMPRCDGVEATR
ncbi:MAG TPA: response regulator transcription factor, partial [Chloroflexota bacterium]